MATQLGDIRGPYRKRSLAERLDQHSIPEPNSGCILWLGATAGMMGYGKIGIEIYGERQRHRVAHLVAWEQEHGPVPAGFELDHKCRTPSCINPDHLEVVTHSVNQRRGTSPIAINAARTHCIRGHELAGANLYTTPDGRRQCRTCQRGREEASRACGSELR